MDSAVRPLRLFRLALPSYLLVLILGSLQLWREQAIRGCHDTRQQVVFAEFDKGIGTWTSRPQLVTWQMIFVLLG